MSELRQFLRYEIPPLLIFLDTSLIILCFIDLSKFLSRFGWIQVFYMDILKTLPGLSVIAALIALPLGWLLYQTYDAFCRPHYGKRSVKLVRELMKDRPLPKGFRANLESNHEEFIDALLFDDNKDNKSILYGLQSYWDQHDARYVVGYYVPVISIVLGVYCLIFLRFNYDFLVSPFSSNFRFVNFLALFAFNILFLPCVVFNSHKRILDEIDARETFFVYLKKDEITKLYNDLNFCNYFKQVESQEENKYNKLCRKITNFLTSFFRAR